MIYKSAMAEKDKNMRQNKIANTREVARVLGVSTSKLSRAVWDGRVDAPMRGPGGAFLWDLESIQRASWQLLGKSLDDWR